MLPITEKTSSTYTGGDTDHNTQQPPPATTEKTSSTYNGGDQQPPKKNSNHNHKPRGGYTATNRPPLLKWWDQFRAVMRRNGLLKLRAPGATIAEVFLPVIIMVAMIGIRLAVTQKDLPVTHYDHLATNLNLTDAMQRVALYTQPFGRKLAFAPDIPVVRRLAANLTADYPQLFGTPRFFATEGALNDYLESADYGKFKDLPTVWAALVFNKIGSASTGDRDWQLKIMMNATQRAQGFDPPACVPDTRLRKATDDLQLDYVSADWSKYYWFGFSGLQVYAERFMLRESTGYESNTDFRIQPFPTYAHRSDDFAILIGEFLGLLYTLAYMWPVTRLVSIIVQERETRNKELLKMSGMRESAYQMAMWITYVLIFALSSAMIAAVTSTTVYEHSDKGLIFMFFFLFGLCIYSFAVLVSAFFSRARVASTMGGVVFLIVFFPYYVVSGDDVDTGQKTAACLSPTICFGLGANIIAKLETAQQGLTASSFTNTIDNFKASTVFIMLFIDACLLLLLGWYFERIVPKDEGVAESCCFCLCGGSRRSRRGRSDVLVSPEVAAADDLAARTQPNVEPLPEEQYDDVAIKLRHLRKEFGTSNPAVPNFVAVKDLSLDMYNSQIFALLGQNGAGKSTTFNMLTGLYSQTSGYATSFGRRIDVEMDTIRTSMGVCPQHSVLYPELSVIEHLELYAQIKGVDPSLVSEAAEEMVVDLGLTEKRHSRSAHLSGGQQRKLSLGCAFIGGSKLVFLDEPTTGLDVYSRRLTWDMLRRFRHGRCIILTTHFMDEADQLADRIAILSRGELKCCGSSLFLKSLYGVGYTMSVVKNAHQIPDRPITKAIQSHIPSAEVVATNAGQISYRLRFSSASKFPAMFDDIDSRSEKLGINSYGVSVTTLEEVFLSVDQGTVAEQIELQRMVREVSVKREESMSIKASTTANNNTVEVVTAAAADDGSVDTAMVGVPSELRERSMSTQLPKFAYEEATVLSHVRALLVKRYLNTKRDKKQRMWTLVYPVLIVFGAMLFLELAARTTFPQAVLTTLSYNSPNYVPYFNGAGLLPTHLTAQTGGGNSVPVNASTLEAPFRDRQMSEYLLLPTTFPQSRYGAYNVHSLQNVTIFINTTATHALPVYTNLWHNMLMQQRSNSDPSAKLTVIMQPLPLTADQKTFVSFTLAIMISIGYAFIPAAFGGFIVLEREVSAKHQQIISGVNINAYWLSTYIWDLLNFLPPAIMSLLIIVIFNVKELLGEATPVTILLILMYGVSVAPFTYVLSFLFKSHTSAQNMLLMLYIMTGSILLIISIVMWSISDTTNDIQDVLVFFYRLLPNFCFGEALAVLTMRKVSFLFGTPRSPWDFDVVGWPMIFMVIDTVVYSSMVLLIEKLLRTPAWMLALGLQHRTEQQMTDEQDKAVDEDEDVKAERERIQQVSNDNAKGRKDACMIQGLRKVFAGQVGEPPKIAVRNMWLGIAENECFGLLGANGAGKSTLIRMLTADELPTAGTGRMKGFDILKDQASLRRVLGYCPQHDALIGTLTAREQLTLYARIKGIPERMVAASVDEILDKLGLNDGGMADRPCVGYSGGNRRKLSVGISLIGNPSVLFLDEPSSGMDAKTRRFMWDLISSNMAGRSVVLTSHSMEEVEALCGRIGIMVGGRLRCLGSAQHLKHRYGAGFQMDINTGTKTVKTVRAFMKKRFGTQVRILERHHNIIKYRIQPNVASLADLFRIMEQHRNDLNIHEYAISETTLEQIFISFAKQQLEEQVMVAGITNAEDDDEDDDAVVQVEAEEEAEEEKKEDVAAVDTVTMERQPSIELTETLN